ncbi:hypothetical protein V6Z11_D08G286200 [Gossypium hirsutum]
MQNITVQRMNNNNSCYMNLVTRSCNVFISCNHVVSRIARASLLWLFLLAGISDRILGDQAARRSLVLQSFAFYCLYVSLQHSIYNIIITVMIIYMMDTLVIYIKT